MEFNIDIHT
jgi:hypothetical protein